MSKLYQNFKTGFSFAEILFAVICVGVLLAPIFQMLGQGSIGVSRNRNEILAQQHAANLIAYAATLPFDHSFLKIGSYNLDKLSANFTGGNLNLDITEPGFSRRMIITQPSIDKWRHVYKVIVVNVTWKENQGQTRSFQQAGLITR